MNTNFVYHSQAIVINLSGLVLDGEVEILKKKKKKKN